MFKYISEIIGKISMAQRIWALLIVLITIIIVTLGPPTLDALSQDNEELTLKVERQRRQILNLSMEVDSLNSLVIKNQRDCTNRIVDREEEIYAQIDRLERLIRSQSLQVQEPRTGSSGDEEVSQMRYIDNGSTQMVQGLRTIKKDIKNHIDDCKENGK